MNKLLLLLLFSSAALAAPLETNLAGETTKTETVPAVVTPATLPPAPPYAKALRDDMKKILQGDDFHQQEQSRHLVMRDWLRKWLEPDKKKENKPLEPFNLSGLAKIFKIAAIAVLALALGWLLWHGWQWLSPRMTTTRKKSMHVALEAQTLILQEDTLPAAVSATARAAWQRGDAIQALSLLYRGAVQALEKHYRITLPPSATEGECLRLARRSNQKAVSQGFAPIVRAWMALAYARRRPENFEELATLYVQHFENSLTENSSVGEVTS